MYIMRASLLYLINYKINCINISNTMLGILFIVPMAKKGGTIIKKTSFLPHKCSNNDGYLIIYNAVKASISKWIFKHNI